MIIKKRILNFVIDVSTIFRIFRKKKFNNNVFRCNLFDFDIFTYENDVYKEIKIKNENTKN